MILQASKTIIKFNGDVGIGLSTDGSIGFQDLENPQEPGTKVENDNNIFPVIFKFEKIESIDAVISQLKKAREIIKDKIESEEK